MQKARWQCAAGSVRSEAPDVAHALLRSLTVAACLPVLPCPCPTLPALALPACLQLHVTGVQGADELIRKHVGGMLAPPASPEALAALPEPVAHEFQV